MRYYHFEYWQEQAKKQGYVVKTYDDLDVLLEELFQDHEPGEIAKMLGVSSYSIRLHLRSLGIKLRSVGRHYLFDAETVKEMYGYYQKGKSCEWIGEKYKASWKCIYDSLKRHGYPLRPQGGFRHRNGSRRVKKYGKNKD